MARISYYIRQLWFFFSQKVLKLCSLPGSLGLILRSIWILLTRANSGFLFARKYMCQTCNWLSRHHWRMVFGIIEDLLRHSPTMISGRIYTKFDSLPNMVKNETNHICKVSVDNETPGATKNTITSKDRELVYPGFQWLFSRQHFAFQFLCTFGKWKDINRACFPIWRIIRLNSCTKFVNILTHRFRYFNNFASASYSYSTIIRTRGPLSRSWQPNRSCEKNGNLILTSQQLVHHHRGLSSCSRYQSNVQPWWV